MIRSLALALLVACGVWAQSGRVTLHANKADLATVLHKQIGPAMGKNVYLAPEVRGTVTVDLDEVPAERALDIVLRLQDSPLAYKIVGSTLVVARPERLHQIPDHLFR